MLYQISFKLHKLINYHEYDLTFEEITVMNQMICTRRQIVFQTIRAFILVNIKGTIKAIDAMLADEKSFTLGNVITLCRVIEVVEPQVNLSYFLFMLTFE